MSNIIDSFMSPVLFPWIGIATAALFCIAGITGTSERHRRSRYIGYIMATLSLGVIGVVAAETMSKELVSLVVCTTCVGTTTYFTAALAFPRLRLLRGRRIRS